MLLIIFTAISFCSIRYLKQEANNRMSKSKLILLLAILFSTFRGVAQPEKVKYLPYIDQRRLHLGFSLGVHTQDLVFTQNGYTTEEGENWFAEIPNFSPGFAVGLVADLAFTEQLNLRFTPSMYFGSKTVKFREQNTKERLTQDIKSNYLALPVNLKYSSRRVNNYRPYMMAGVSPMLDLSKRKETPILLKRFDTCIEIGLGCDVYLPYFKLIPELNFSFGLFNLLAKNRKDLKDPGMIKFTESLDKIKSRMVVLSFYFE